MICVLGISDPWRLGRIAYSGSVIPGDLDVLRTRDQ
jgi:hypothetical protein